MCWDQIPDEGDLRRLLTGKATKLESQFRLTYTMILNLLRVEELKASYPSLSLHLSQERKRNRTFPSLWSTSIVLIRLLHLIWLLFIVQETAEREEKSRSLHDILPIKSLFLLIVDPPLNSSSIWWSPRITLRVMLIGVKICANK